MGYFDLADSKNFIGYIQELAIFCLQRSSGLDGSLKMVALRYGDPTKTGNSATVITAQSVPCGVALLVISL